MLVVVFDHLIADAWSVILFEEELASAYDWVRGGSQDRLSRVEPTYYDFVDWISGGRDEALRKWRAVAAQRPVIPLLRLSAEEEPEPGTAPEAGFVTATLLPSEVDSVEEFAAENGLAVIDCYLAAYASALRTAVDDDEVSVIMPFANRMHRGTSEMLGWFAGVSLMCFEPFSARSFVELARQVASERQAVERRSDIPFDELLETLIPSSGPRLPFADFNFFDAAKRRVLFLGEAESSPYRTDADWNLEEGYNLTVIHRADGTLHLEAMYESHRLAERDALAVLDEVVGVLRTFKLAGFHQPG
ncbi:hypothetical protein SUDANB95_04904 [Actinosynnema sp. ALI-1.44]